MSARSSPVVPALGQAASASVTWWHGLSWLRWWARRQASTVRPVEAASHLPSQPRPQLQAQSQSPLQLQLQPQLPQQSRTRSSESQDRFGIVFEPSREGIMTLRPDGMVLSCNPAAARLFDTEAATLVGNNLAERIEQIGRAHV